MRPQTIVLLFQLTYLGLLIVDIYCLVDAIRRPEAQYKPGYSKTLWITLLIVSLVLPLGLLITPPSYLLSARKRVPRPAISADPGQGLADPS